MSDRDQRRIEAEISKGGSSTDPFASAVKATRMPMIITDPHQDDNPIIFVNDAFCRLTGYDRDELIGRNCRFLQGPQTNPADVSLIREAIRERRPIELELLNHKKSGEVFWNKLLISPVFDDAGALTFFFASQFDITFERTTRSEFHIKSQEFEALAENVSHLAWMAAPDGNIFWYNRRWYDYTGYDLETMKGWGWRAVHRPEKVDEVIDFVGRQWAAGVPWESIFDLRAASGEYRSFLTRVEPIHDDAGRLIRWFGTNTDITAQLDSERRLSNLNEELEVRVATAITERMRTEEQLRQAQKLEAVGQLTGGVAHDFNNLLTVIRSATDLLKRPDLPADRRDRYVSAISETVDRAAKLTSQLLAFARRQALRPEVFDACRSVTAIGEMMGTLAGARVAITYDLPASACHVNADPSQFDTALVNMVVNARDAMEGEGTIVIKVEAVGSMPPIRLHARIDSPFVAVSITDGGSGIAADVADRIFEPFFTTKGVGQGTGLGLSQVFGFAKQSGGEVMVESMVGQGTTFTLFLPAAAAPSSDAGDDADIEPEPLADGHGTCILLVEDNQEVRAFATRALDELGYKTVQAANADEALAELARDGDRFEAVFSDVVMPGMSGIELAILIRRDRPNLPIVLTSGYSHVLARNADDGFELLHKPYSVEQLSRILRRSLSRSKAIEPA